MNRKTIVKIVLFVCSIFFSTTTFSQDFLDPEVEAKILMSDEYYAEYGYSILFEDARNAAIESLVNVIITSAISSTINADEILKEIDMNAHTARLRNDGQCCVLAWIHKDSIFLTVSKTLHKKEKESEIQTPIVKSTVSLPENMMHCRNYSEFRRILVKSGFIYGDINSTVGFPDPSKCFIAVFSKDGELKALLDRGDSVRMNLLDNSRIDNPITYYKELGCLLWYFSK